LFAVFTVKIDIKTGNHVSVDSVMHYLPSYPRLLSYPNNNGVYTQTTSHNLAAPNHQCGSL